MNPFDDGFHAARRPAALATECARCGCVIDDGRDLCPACETIAALQERERSLRSDRRQQRLEVA